MQYAKRLDRRVTPKSADRLANLVSWMRYRLRAVGCVSISYVRRFRQLSTLEVGHERNTHSCRQEGGRLALLPLCATYGGYPIAALPRVVLGTYLGREPGTVPYYDGLC